MGLYLFVYMYIYEYSRQTDQHKRTVYAYVSHLRYGRRMLSSLSCMGQCVPYVDSSICMSSDASIQMVGLSLEGKMMLGGLR